MGSHPHDGSHVGLLVVVERAWVRVELRVLEELAAFPQRSLDLRVTATAALSLAGQTAVDGPVPAGIKERVGIREGLGIGERDWGLERGDWGSERGIGDCRPG